MTARHEFFARLRGWYGASEQAISLVERTCDLYEREKVLRDGEDKPLYDVCPCRADCWDGRGREAERPGRDHAGVSAPFIGANYEQRRIAIIAVNGASSLDNMWWLCGKHIESQRTGGRGAGGRAFAYGAIAYARVVDAALDGRVLDDWDNPPREALVPTWDSCAVLEAVKCVPQRTRIAPYQEMVLNCPRLLLRHELAILRPRVVILLSRGALRDAVRPLLQVKRDHYPPEIAHPGHIERDRFELHGDTVELFCCNHPSGMANQWRASLAQLHDSLQCRPL